MIVLGYITPFNIAIATGICTGHCTLRIPCFLHLIRQGCHKLRTLILFIISPCIICIKHHVVRIKGIYESCLGSHITPATRTDTSIIEFVHRTVYECLHIEVSTSRTLCSLSVLNQRPDDFFALVIVSKENLTIVRSQRIMVVINYLFSIGQSIIIMVFTYPCLRIQVHTGKQEPGCHAIYSTINISTRSLQVAIDILQFTFSKFENLLARPLYRNILHTGILVYIRHGTKHITQSSIAISTDKTSLSTIRSTLISQLIPETTRLQFILSTLTQQFVAISYSHVQTLISPADNRSIRSIPLQIQTLTQSIGRRRHDEIISTQLLQIEHQAHIARISFIGTFKVTIATITAFLSCQDKRTVTFCQNTRIAISRIIYFFAHQLSFVKRHCIQVAKT